MKTSKDPRHIKRIKLMRTLFSWNFLKKEKPPKEIAQIIKNLTEIDAIIKESASDRPISGINRIDLAILRLAVFELIIARDYSLSERKYIIEESAPAKVIIDEAVELGKEFGSDSSSAFINGALGQVVKLNGVKI